jgi:hypothetical protein
MAAWHPQTWWQAWRARRAVALTRNDPADMGTVFGLEACQDELPRPIDRAGFAPSTQSPPLPVAERLKGRSVW